VSSVSTTIAEEREVGRSFLGFGIALALILWATAFVGIRVAVEYYPPGPLALLRFSVASVLLGIYLLASSKGRSLLKSRPKDWLGFLSLGFTGIVVYHVALNTGEQTVSSGAASLLVNTTPVFTVLLAVVFLGDRLGKRGSLGMTIAFGGAVLVAMAGTDGLTLDIGAFWILLAAVAQAFYFIVQKKMLSRFGALELTTVSTWCGFLMLGVYGPELVDTMATAPREATLVGLYLGVGPSAIGYLSWAYVVSCISVSRAVAYLYLVPALALVIGYLLLDERPSLLSLVGGAATILGVALVHRR
jgi:drug/metabolite transporter (DMT)-like permease